MRTTSRKRRSTPLRVWFSASLWGTQAERPARMRTSGGVSELNDATSLRGAAMPGHTRRRSVAQRVSS
jgi:hypothetical protein